MRTISSGDKTGTHLKGLGSCQALHGLEMKNAPAEV